jgi:hypothetical protein
MRYLLFIGILTYMFLSTSVAAKIGIKQVGTYSSLITVFLFAVKFLGDSKHKLFNKFKEEFHIILIGFFLIFIKIFLGQSDQINQILFFLIVPMSLSILLGVQNISNKRVIRKLILFFFITECFLAIYERWSLTNVFPYANDMDDSAIVDWSFRSSGFIGHPLANALCVSTIMGFILTTPMKLVYKLFFLILGFVSLLCFNARAAIIIWILLATIYLLNLIRDKKTKKTVSLLLVFFLISAIYFVYSIIVDYGLGGRIVKEDINDGSAQTRFEVFDAFTYIDKSDLWFGNAANYIPVMHKLGAGGVENSYIVLIMNYGIFIFIILSLFYYYLIKRFLKDYSLYYKFIILTSFLIVGSTNNALASATPWGFLILCFYAFHVIGEEQIRDKFNITNKASIKNENDISRQVHSFIKWN